MNFCSEMLWVLLGIEIGLFMAVILNMITLRKKKPAILEIACPREKAEKFCYLYDLFMEKGTSKTKYDFWSYVYESMPEIKEVKGKHSLGVNLDDVLVPKIKMTKVSK